MDERGNTVKCEKILLGFTALFLAFLLVLFFRDRAAMEAAPVTVETETAVSQGSFMPDVSPLNINAAAAEELAALPGIGEVLAGRIVAYREEHGPFQSPEELMEVSGIGPGIFEDLRDYITVN